MPITSSGAGMPVSRVRSLMGRSFIESAGDVRGNSKHAVRKKLFKRIIVSIDFLPF